jgi:hypothetical protein
MNAFYNYEVEPRSGWGVNCGHYTPPPDPRVYYQASGRGFAFQWAGIAIFVNLGCAVWVKSARFSS